MKKRNIWPLEWLELPLSSVTVNNICKCQCQTDVQVETLSPGGRVEWSEWEEGWCLAMTAQRRSITLKHSVDLKQEHTPRSNF